MADTKQQVQSQFGKTSHNYLTSTVHAAGSDLQLLAGEIKKAGAKTVLDAGCGAGHASAAVAPFVEKVTAYDLTVSMLEQVRQLCETRGIENIETRQGDVEALPFVDHTFDAVVTRYSAHHWPDVPRALSEIHRVIKPGGVFLMADVVSFETPVFDTFLQTIELLRDHSHVRDYTIAEWQRMLTSAGFEVEEVLTWGIDLEFAAWVARMDVPPDNEAMLRKLFAQSSDEVQQAFHLRENSDFTIPGALLRAAR